MYTKYWNLSAAPFLNIMDERFVYMTDQHREGLARLSFLVDEERMAGMLTGPFGVGKSLTLELLARRAQSRNIPVIRMDAIPGGMLPMARFVLRSMGIKEDPPTLQDALMLLQIYCQTPQPNMQHRLLIIDEAHYLASDNGYYFAHYLCNLRLPATSSTPERQLFTLVLVGTEELRRTVNAYESLRRRIQLDWVLQPLSQRETLEYVQHRIRCAGGDIWLFTQDALAEVYTWSDGVPRDINHLCDTALMLGYAGQVASIDVAIVRQAASDTGLDKKPKEPTESDVSPVPPMATPAMSPAPSTQAFPSATSFPSSNFGAQL